MTIHYQHRTPLLYLYNLNWTKNWQFWQRDAYLVWKKQTNLNLGYLLPPSTIIDSITSFYWRYMIYYDHLVHSSRYEKENLTGQLCMARTRICFLLGNIFEISKFQRKISGKFCKNWSTRSRIIKRPTDGRIWRLHKPSLVLKDMRKICCTTCGVISHSSHFSFHLIIPLTNGTRTNR